PLRECAGTWLYQCFRTKAAPPRKDRWPRVRAQASAWASRQRKGLWPRKAQTQPTNETGNSAWLSRLLGDVFSSSQNFRASAAAAPNRPRRHQMVLMPPSISSSPPTMYADSAAFLLKLPGCLKADSAC